LILGASEGVGVAFARRLGQAGINSVLVARQAAEAMRDIMLGITVIGAAQ
jgi:short-subunit dehydrogenase